jgi:predicted ABC-type ATPase
LEAAKQAELLRNRLLDKNLDFSFETVLSTERNLLLLQKAKTKGYEIQCIYVLTCDENINVARVKSRVASGGHDVPEDKIRERYPRAIALLPQVIEVCDKLLIFDNTNEPELIFSKSNDSVKLTPNNNWIKAKLQELIGMYSD